jgi:Ca2+-binding EF-hand superfamily protein
MFQQLDTNKDGVVTTQEVEAAAAARFAAADTNKDGKLSPEERQAEHEKHMTDKFERKDANDDGLLERSEVAQMPQGLFDRLDSNKDGKLSPEEMQGLKALHHGDKGGEGHKHWGADSNGDGSVTKAEYLEKAKHIMTKFDSNGDGKVTQAEADAARAKFGRGFHHGHAGQTGSQTPSSNQ